MQTANDPFDTPRALELLTRLGGAISGFAERERQLVKAHNHRLYLVRRQSDRASEDLEADLSTRIGTVKAMHQQALEKAGRDHAHRKGRIAHAYHSSRKMIAERAAMAKDRVVGQTQADIMQTRHLRQEELARAERQHETFGKLLAKDMEELAALRREARSITRERPVVRAAA